MKISGEMFLFFSSILLPSYLCSLAQSEKVQTMFFICVLQLFGDLEFHFQYRCALIQTFITQFYLISYLN